MMFPTNKLKDETSEKRSERLIGIKKWKEKNKKSVYLYNKGYYEKNKEKINKRSVRIKRRVPISPIRNSLILSGRISNKIRDIVLERDSWQCVYCGMSIEQHILLFNRKLSVDHIDGNGRNSEIPNNGIDNLQTLCLRCHGKKDIIRRNWRPIIEYNLTTERRDR